MSACSTGRSGVLAALAALATAAGSPAEPVVGGWAPAAVTDTNVVAAAGFAVEAQAAEETTDREPVRMELVAVREAAQQVVAGMNYRLVMTVRRNGEERRAEAVVWWQAWRQPDPYRLTSWTWK